MRWTLADALRPPEKPNQQTSTERDLWRYASLGMQLAATVILFVLAGWWLDKHYGWSPWATLGLGMLGVAALIPVCFFTKTSFIWYGMVGCVVTYVGGLIVSLLDPPLPPERLKGLVFDSRYVTEEEGAAGPAQG